LRLEEEEPGEQPVSASVVRGTRCGRSHSRVARDFSVSRFSQSFPLIQPTTVIFLCHEPEALADFLHIEGTRLAPQGERTLVDLRIFRPG
jgi:hypothetical protein